MPDLGEQIKKAMASKGMKQSELAASSQLSSAIISQICTGKTKDPMFEKVVAIARSLDVSLNYLAGKTDEFGTFNLSADASALCSEPSLDAGEQKLLEHYGKLDKKGQRLLLEIAEDLVDCGHYPCS